MADTKWKYGALNAIEYDKFARRLEVNSNNSLAYIRDAVRTSLFEKNLDLTGEFHGIVLQKIPDTQFGNVSDSLSFYDSIMGYFDSESKSTDKKEIIRVKVRVPELDAMIPEPDSLNDSKQIGMHQTFRALVSDEVPSTLEWGQPVIVSLYTSAGVFEPTIKKTITGANRVVSQGPRISPAAAYGDSFVGPIPPGDPGWLPANHVSKTTVEVSPGVAYKPNRVRVHEGITPLPPASSLLVPVASRPGYRQQKIHTLVKQRFDAMATAISNAIGAQLYVQSGWRKHAWNSRSEYESAMIERYGSVEEGELLKAYVSPHETGLAVDFYIAATNSNEVDIAPSQRGKPKYGSNTLAQQKRTKAFKWLKENAHRFGFTPYRKEAWHWEVLLPIESWKTGRERTEEYDVSDYNTRITEKSVANGKVTSNRDFTFE